MCTAVPPPSPPRPPKYVPKDPPTPPKPTVHGPYSAKTLQLIRDNHGGRVQYFVDGVLNCRAMYRFAVQQPKKNPLRVWQEGLRISRSHFLNRDEEHAAVVLEVLCATPKHPPIPKPPPQPVPRRPPPPRARDQVTLTQYSRHHRSSLLPMAPAPKRPCPTPQFGSLLGPPSQSAPPTAEAPVWVIAPCASPPAVWLVARAASLSVRPPTAEAPVWVIAPCASPPAATPDFGETVQFPALRQRLRKWTFTVFFNTTSQSAMNCPACACCACGRGRIVEHTLDPWISKLVEAILANEGSGERYWLGLSIHGFLETNQNSGAE